MAAVNQADKIEPAQRAAIFKRLGELLTQQCELLSGYIAVLEKQSAFIGTGSADDLLAHVETEEQIIAGIFSIQKVIDPLEAMYHADGSCSPDDDIPVLKAEMEDLKNRAAVLSARNRELLSARMADIRAEMKVLGENLSRVNARRSPYDNSASLIDIEG